VINLNLKFNSIENYIVFSESRIQPQKLDGVADSLAQLGDRRQSSDLHVHGNGNSGMKQIQV
jgi:hypothetical protein